ncbi:MAG: L,D-transpeptidase/peptidoglycan binding protein [Muribaculaceae bacterium]|nr:L,D-transpeptidase/peptidoglycan binding protein [Roseburia sp.]MCM1431774.1 L,D-transpeptidase/peptidoglycan binding protein [Muribaculaceae bacterium]MCM1493360.1 L,D-transpeptidase/peptidoglycan binding protein [Muribaculaceae bacterium]
MATKSTHKKRKAPGGLVIALALTLSAVLGGYIGGAVYYRNHYFPNTTVGDVACGNQTAASVEVKNIANGSDYLLTILDRRGDKYHIAGMDFDYTYNKKGEELAILNSQSFLAWPVELFRPHHYDMDRSFTYDSAKLKTLVDGLALFSEDLLEAPQNAYLDITESGYQVVEEQKGNTPIAENVLAAIVEAIDNQEESLLLSDDCYEAPEITTEDESLKNAIAQLDAYTASTIHYEIDGVDEKLTSTKILSMLEISEDGGVTVNEEKVERFVQYMASTYNTYGDVRKFKTSEGDTVKIGGGDYGWVINKTGEKAQILADLAGGVPVSREPVYEQRAIQSGLDDIGDSYVEIDYTNQHLWYYKEGELVVDTDIVSGNVSRGNGSPDGVFKIVYCQRDATLIGEDYASSVKYFMPFAYNVGIHDADWRNKFGGEIYKTSGSHGCINVPEKAAKTIIDAIDLGTPVIAYYREPVKLTAENAKISNAYSYVDPEKED